MAINKENAFTEQNRFIVYSDQLNTTKKQILDTAREMISRSAIQAFEDEGETITATDASYLASLTIDGKAVQDGTPTPTNPVPIEVVGLNDDSEFGIQIGETLYPINLQGNALVSLPDGTKDVLTVDSVGHVVLEKRTNRKVFDGSETWTAFAFAHGSGFYSTEINDMIGTSAAMVDKAICSAFTITSSNNDTYDGNMYFDSNKLPCCINSHYTVLNSFKAWLAANPVYLYYACTLQTVDLGYISMPPIPNGAEISITAQVTPTIAAKWWTKNQSDVAKAFGAVSSDLAALQGAISALDARVTALEGSNTKSPVLEKHGTSKEDAQEEMNLDDAE